jgi:thiol-disulfide isomerase/thioredoxin
MSNPFITQPNFQSNRFLEKYDRQDTEFLASVYEMRNGKLSKLVLNRNNLEKCVIIFIGDWCPHCEKFMAILARYIDLLRLYGVRVIFLVVPPIERLRSWKEPTTEDYASAKRKVGSAGIELYEGKVQIALLGDAKTLTTAGIGGLPVFMAIKDGKEKFRGTGEGVLTKLDFSNQDVLKDFIMIWDEEASDEEKSKKKKGEEADSKSDGKLRQIKRKETKGRSTRPTSASKPKRKAPPRKAATKAQRNHEVHRSHASVVEARRRATDSLNRIPGA